MNDPSASTDAPPVLQLAHCPHCDAWTFPAEAYGCRRCGAPDLERRALPGAPRLANFVTVQSELAPGLPVPCVIGEVELAPGIVEEVLIDAADESGLALGMPLRAVGTRGEQGRIAWRFVPEGAR